MLDFEDTLIFPAPKFPAGDWKPSGLKFTDVYFLTDDGLQLHGWFFDHANARGHALYFHGAAENVAMAGPLVAQISERLRLASFVIDYRGYGRSEGTPSEEGVFADARAASRWLCERCKLSAPELILLGCSLGGAVAVDLAAEQSARALILHNSFSSIREVFERHAPPRLALRVQFDSLKKITRYSGPLWLSHGTADELVPVDLALKLFSAHEGRKELFLFDGNHETLPSANYYSRLDRFLVDVFK